MASLYVYKGGQTTEIPLVNGAHGEKLLWVRTADGRNLYVSGFIRQDSYLYYDGACWMGTLLNKPSYMKGIHFVDKTGTIYCMNTTNTIYTPTEDRSSADATIRVYLKDQKGTSSYPDYLINVGNLVDDDYYDQKIVSLNSDALYIHLYDTEALKIAATEDEFEDGGQGYQISLYDYESSAGSWDFYLIGFSCFMGSNGKLHFELTISNSDDDTFTISDTLDPADYTSEGSWGDGNFIFGPDPNISGRMDVTATSVSTKVPFYTEGTYKW